eukprot:9260092-Pyramimonas_sp.AAC.1
MGPVATWRGLPPSAAFAKMQPPGSCWPARSPRPVRLLALLVIAPLRFEHHFSLGALLGPARGE